MSTTLGALSAGSIVKLKENGSLAKFYVGKHDYESELNGSGRTYLIRDELLPVQSWNSAGDNTYASSSIHKWLCGDYLNQFEEAAKTAIGTTKFYYTPGDGDVSVATMSAAIFLPSATEMGKSSSMYMNAEGSALPIASTILLGKRSGVAVDYWTRTPSRYNYEYSYIISGDGDNLQRCCTNTYCIRPTFTLPATTTVNDDNEIVFTQAKSNTPPVVSANLCSNGGDLGVKNEAFRFTYTVTDADNDKMLVTERVVDSKSYSNVESSTAFTIGELSSASRFQKLKNGSHTITITANDGTDLTTFLCTFRKELYTVTVTLKSPLAVSGDITSAVLSVVGNIPDDAVYEVYATNNGNDSSPVWQDISSEAKTGTQFTFSNKNASNGAAFNFKLSIGRGSSGVGGYISGISGSFQ